MSPLSLKTYAGLLLSKLTTCVTTLDSIDCGGGGDGGGGAGGGGGGGRGFAIDAHGG
jgi:hypothetical protein